ncbi:hypothetical protein L6164_004656 [Bauhinia variegata]|uniref:Uncharacterized protein n=1 Tax=Bauhinia variegata TaxID=167791 RepID=A0ACB9Q4J5_BAUVA|nr:hypothetical protein L6164_004656 [Bauhinia variegata]
MLMGARSTAVGLVRAPAALTSNNDDDNKFVSKLVMFNVITNVKVVVVVFINVLLVLSSCAPDSRFNEADALLRLKGSLNNAVRLGSWDPSINPKPPCSGNRNNWEGVICVDDKVLGLRLESMGLHGKIDIDSLVALPFLRMLSLMNNTFTGSIPSINMLHHLRSIYLSYNHFSGEIPDDAFKGMHKLKKVYLSNNEFTGKIPSSLASLPNLMHLRLDANKFQGQIPTFSNATRLTVVDFSNNELEGFIPDNLRPFPATAFSGNAKLCGRPLDSSCSAAAVETPAKTTVLKIFLIVMLTAVLIAILVAAFITIFRLRSSNQRQQIVRLGSRHAAAMSSSATTLPNSSRGSSKKYAPPVYRQQQAAGVVDHHKVAVGARSSAYHHQQQAAAGKLSFVRDDDRQRFDVHDLLKASAEILGSATFGSSYKAVVLDGSQVVVVKRYKQMNNVGREEFQEHMRRLGALSHPNLLPLVAYYYRKEEKLLLTDFVDNGCLASHLHGNHNLDKPCLDWPTRLRIVKGVARGLAYLYSALPSVVVPHGHLKSSNVLLDESFNPLLTDYALIPLTNIDLAQQQMMPYKSPEYAQLGRITKKTDVWSLGILILEILTGKFPENYLKQRHDSASDIASWVNAMITEKRTSEVFDVEMGELADNKAELLKLLKIGLSCCEENVERRLDIKEALEQIEDLKEVQDIGGYSHTINVTRHHAHGDSYSAAV